MFLRISSGTFKGRKIKVPFNELRPTCEKVRAAFFNSLFSLIDFKDRNFLDIFSGSGAFAIEAVSRGFCSATAIEKDSKAANQIYNSSTILNITDKIQILNKDVFMIEPTWFENKKFSAIYIDPPYVIGNKIPELIQLIICSDIIDNVCVICVEGNSFSNWNESGWSCKEKKFGDTCLSFFYNWEGKDD